MEVRLWKGLEPHLLTRDLCSKICLKGEKAFSTAVTATLKCHLNPCQETALSPAKGTLFICFSILLVTRRWKKAWEATGGGFQSGYFHMLNVFTTEIEELFIQDFFFFGFFFLNRKFNWHFTETGFILFLLLLFPIEYYCRG